VTYWWIVWIGERNFNINRKHVISFHLPLAPRSSTPILVSLTKNICRDIVSHVRKIRQLLASTAALLPTYYDESCIVVHLRGHNNDQSGKAKLSHHSLAPTGLLDQKSHFWYQFYSVWRTKNRAPNVFSPNHGKMTHHPAGWCKKPSPSFIFSEGAPFLALCSRRLAVCPMTIRWTFLGTNWCRQSMSDRCIAPCTSTYTWRPASWLKL
jgi:hypothetical protein